MAKGPVVASMAVQVEGLRELVKGLKGGEERLDLELRKRLRTLAKDVAGDAKRIAAGLQPRPPAKVISSIRGSAQATSAQVKLGAEANPYALGWEFGAMHNQPRQTRRGMVEGWNQFPAWRGSGSEAGYFLWPAVRENRAKLETDLMDAIDEIVGKD